MQGGLGGSLVAAVLLQRLSIGPGGVDVHHIHVLDYDSLGGDVHLGALPVVAVRSWFGGPLLEVVDTRHKQLGLVPDVAERRRHEDFPGAGDLEDFFYQPARPE